MDALISGCIGTDLTFTSASFVDNRLTVIFLVPHSSETCRVRRFGEKNEVELIPTAASTVNPEQAQQDVAAKTHDGCSASLWCTIVAALPRRRNNDKLH